MNHYKEKVIICGRNASIGGVLTKNQQINFNKFCVLFLNAGLIHKVGPNRLYVKIARKIAKHGIISFRFDYTGIGDSETYEVNENSGHKNLDELIQVMEVIYKNTSINRFVIIGICSGAEEAFKIAEIDDRIIGLVLINGNYSDTAYLKNAFPEIKKRTTLRYYKKNILSYRRWIKVVRGQSNAFSKKNIEFVFTWGLSFAKKLTGLSKNHQVKEDNSPVTNKNTDIYEKWVHLLNKNINIYLIYSEGSSSFDTYTIDGSKEFLENQNSNLLKVRVYKKTDHTFTPSWSQNLLTKSILNWLKNTLF